MVAIGDRVVGHKALMSLPDRQARRHEETPGDGRAGFASLRKSAFGRVDGRLYRGNLALGLFPDKTLKGEFPKSGRLADRPLVSWRLGGAADAEASSKIPVRFGIGKAQHPVELF